MKKLILLMFLFIALGSISEVSARNPHKTSINNRLKYAKRAHQREIFVSFLHCTKKNKGTMSQSFAPKGQSLIPKHLFKSI